MNPSITFAVVAAAFALNTSAAVAQPLSTADAPTDRGTPMTEHVAPKQGPRPHSHFEEKTHTVAVPPVPSAEKPNPWRDYSRHFHPRDGK